MDSKNSNLISQSLTQEFQIKELASKGYKSLILLKNGRVVGTGNYDRGGRGPSTLVKINGKEILGLPKIIKVGLDLDKFFFETEQGTWLSISASKQWWTNGNKYHVIQKDALPHDNYLQFGTPDYTLGSETAAHSYDGVFSKFKTLTESKKSESETVLEKIQEVKI